MEIKRIENPSKFLVDSGLLFEINRKILHPIGLALEVTMPADTDNEDEKEYAVYSIWDCRDDAEGVLFGKELFEASKEKLKNYMNGQGIDAIAKRQKQLGFVEQTD